jgi:hypothetical protein
MTTKGCAHGHLAPCTACEEERVLADLRAEVERLRVDRDEYKANAIANSNSAHRLAEELNKQSVEVERLTALVLRASTESVVTTSDDPGCFYCDSVGRHSAGCPADAALHNKGD